MDEAARARAESAAARRAKILARQKDRLSKITGSYSGVEQPAQEGETAPQQAASSLSGTTLVAATAAVDATSPATAACAPIGVSTQQQEAIVQEQQQMAALMAAVAENLQRAQAMQQPDGPSSERQQQQQMQDMVSQLISSRTSAAASSSQQSEGLAELQPVQQQQVPLILRLGPVLSAAVKQTQVIRLLSAVLLAYLALSGWDFGIPPGLLLMITNLSIVAAALLLLHGSAAGRKLLAAQQQQQAASEVQMPMRLRSFDFLSLVPGLKELLTALSGYRQLANAVSEDTAAFVVAMGLLVVTLSLQPTPFMV